MLASNIDILEDSCVDRISSKHLGFNAYQEQLNMVQGFNRSRPHLITVFPPGNGLLVI